MKRKNRTVHSQPPVSPAAQPHHEYGKTFLGLASEFAYDTPNGEEHGQLVALLDRCVNEGEALAKSCWVAARPADMAGVAYDRLVEQAEDLATLDMAYRRGNWLAGFIRLVLDVYRHRNGDVTPEDVLRMLSEEHNGFMCDVGVARRVLRNHPESVQDELRKAAAALPDTHPPADQAECGAA